MQAHVCNRPVLLTGMYGGVVLRWLHTSDVAFPTVECGELSAYSAQLQRCADLGGW
jgi:hypothetical protein